MEKKPKVNINTRKTASVNLADFCIFSMGPERKGKGDFLEVTEWSNGEGYDIHISNVSGETDFRLTFGQMEALKKCVKAIEKFEEK